MATLEVNRWIMERLGVLSVLLTACVLGEFLNRSRLTDKCDFSVILTLIIDLIFSNT